MEMKESIIERDEPIKKMDQSSHLLDTREVLLINSDKFPPLELYDIEHVRLETAYIEWLKKETIGKNVCYLDLTFEVPNKGSTTLSIVSSKMLARTYDELMSDFINNNNTLYSHNDFQCGIQQKNNIGIKSEHFFLYEITFEEGNSNIINLEEGDVAFSATNIDLDAKLKGALRNDPSYFDKINDTEISKHWLAWIKLHENSKNKIISNVGGLLKWVLAVPLGTLTQENKYKNIGAIFLGVDSNCTKEEVIHFTRSLIILLLSSSQKYYEKLALNNSIKSAIAAIMARNMSHNLGSHVFYYTRQELLNIFENEKENANFKYREDIKGLAWFLHYVQERQDFIANINSTEKYPFGPLNLKQDVIDEMTPDAVDVRHNSEPKTKNFLLENIVKSENFKRKQGEAEINLKNLDIKIILRGNGSSDNFYEFSTWEAKNATNFYEIDFAVNFGQQSRHAFLIILENIIRNSAKHGFNTTDKKDLLITIEIVSNIDNYSITIYDNAGNADHIKIYDDQKSHLSNIDILKSKLENIKMLDVNSQTINRENKGLKEILISTLWMKGYNLEEIETYAIDPNILEIVNINGNIGYKFSLSKFNDVVILNHQSIVEYLIENSIFQYGSIYIVSENDLIKATSNQRIIERYNFHDHQELRSELSKRIPRILINPNNLENLWELLYKSKYQDSCIKRISFDRDDSETIECLKDLVILSKTPRKDIHIKFINHLNKSDENLQKYFTWMESLPLSSKPFIVESISGANQVFNLFQKFQAKAINQREQKKLVDLYWKVLDAYNTVIFIIDERLSYGSDLNYFDFVEDLLEPKDNTQFIKNYFDYNEEKYLNELNRIQNSVDSINSKRSQIIDLIDKGIQDGDTKVKKLSHERFKQNLKERFLEQQNTHLYNLGKDNILFNSLGAYNSSIKKNIDFFSIHIGLLDKMEGNDMNENIKLILESNRITPKFISVHSGRGGLNSKDEKITFLPFSVLQRCLEDSKFVLSEFFNNYKYYPY